MSLKGNFKTFNLNSIFQLLSDDQKTGILKVLNADKEIRIYLKDGEIVYATGSQNQDRLGHFLIRKGIITPQQLNEALKKSKAKKRALGQILIEKGLLTSQNLKEIIYQQIEHLIFNLFLWDQGEFEYNDATINLTGMVVPKINLVSLLLEASRRIDEISTLKKQIPDDGQAYRITGRVSDQDEVTLNSAELKVMGMVDGQRSIRQIIQEGGFDEYAAYKILHSLLSSGLIEAIETKPEPAEESEDYAAIITPYHDILQVLFRSLQNELGNQALAIFEESRQVAASQPYEIFRNFQPKNAVDVNTQEISQELAPLKDYQNACQILINSFNEFISNVIVRSNQLLGPKMMRQIIQEIDAVLPRVDTARARVGNKEHAIGEIKHLLSQALEQLGEETG